MVRVWVDGQCLQTPSRHRGIGRYVLNLLAALVRRLDVDIHVSLNAGLPDEALVARDALEAFLPHGNIHLWHGICQIGEDGGGLDVFRQASEIALRHHVSVLQPDVALSASPFEGAGDPASPFRPTAGFDVPCAVICYDFIPLVFADAYLASPRARDAYFRRLEGMKEADLILAISAFTAQHAREVIGGVPVAEIGAGLSPEFVSALDTPRDPSRIKPFSVLCVGSLDWRKNVEIVVRSLEHLSAELRDKIEVRVAGAYTPRDSERLKELQQALGLRAENVHFLGMPSDQDLLEEYRTAALFIQPSLLEGFGLTALEAMACGAPTLASKTGSLPEVVGDSAVLFDPNDARALARLIEASFADPERLEQSGRRGQQRAAGFTWDMVAERFVTALDAIAMPLRNTNLSRQRRRSLQEIRDQKLEKSLLPETWARLMSFAEPTPPGRRLLVEITPVVRSGEPSSTTNALEASIQASTPLLWPSASFVACVGTVSLSQIRPGTGEREAISLQPGDHLLLPYGAAHNNPDVMGIIRSARMMGIPVTVLCPPLREAAVIDPELLGLVSSTRDVMCETPEDGQILAEAIHQVGYSKPIKIRVLVSEEKDTHRLIRAIKVIGDRH